jgi:hypothetical protein
MDCTFVGNTCTRCGRPSLRPDLARNCRPGLGDMIASGLDAVGITKARVQAVADAVGIEDCGCEQRQQLANRLGHLLGIGTPLDGSATTEPQGDAHAETQGRQ